ncbi:hypothetical protein CAEBREN_17681 [Caenorhabditis brenneri]|uniref:Uncharacterized protein n=1 Tax=Caenorhabditis brenneri TaxID=135651 RepID=G0M6R8_CAEBE|nr:hypothetical protein CAEBREN_17681 [Caenorhabditis brenneri]
MNLLQCYPTTTVDEVNCEEWGNGTEASQTVSACQGCVELRKCIVT